MDSNFINIDMEHNDSIIDFEVMSDEHFGDPKQTIGLLEKRQNAIMNEPNRYTAFGGDMVNNIMATDKRWSLESSRYNSLTLEKKEWQDFHAPLFEMNKRLIADGKAPKIWYGLDGNHEINDKKTIDHHWMIDMFEPHGIKYLGSSGFIGLQCSFNGKPVRRYKLAVAHGFGGGSSTEKALNDFMQNKVADVYLMGHFHQKATYEQIVFDYSFKENKYIERKVLLGNTGNFTNSVIMGNTSWFERRNRLKPSPPGTITVSFDPYNDGDFNWHG
jgi:hypothetical protein